MDLITQLGGPTLVAQFCTKRVKTPVTMNMVCMWKQRGNIPYLYRPAVRAMAREIGVDVPENFVPGDDE